MAWFQRVKSVLRAVVIAATGLTSAQIATATPFTMTVPVSGIALPSQYPQAGGVVVILTGANGNIYYQFADPTGGFVGYQNTGTPAAFRGNPFTLYPTMTLNCGYRSCTDYFGGQITKIDIRFTAYDGDTQVGGFDFNDIALRMNGRNVGNWSNETTEKTNAAGTVSQGFEVGFGNNTLNTGWFASFNRPLLDDILSSGQITPMASDNDPNDNYWDFTQGQTLTDTTIRSIAPGYELDKTVVGGATTFLTVGQVIQYQYIVGNIGSVNINGVTVVDNKIPTVTCPTPPANNILRTVATASQPNTITCTGSYTVTQADVDAGVITNIAKANGTPAFGSLGQLSDTVSLTTTRTNDMTLTKSALPSPFGAVGSTVTYTFTVQNTGNTTLSNVAVTDPKIPALSCSFASIPPTAGSNTRTCTGTYTVTQADVDAYAINGTQLSNTATSTATAPDGATLTRTAVRTLTGPTAAPAMTVTKTAVQTNFNAVGNVLQFNIAVRNTGNVTWPAAPTVTDQVNATGAQTVSCPAGPVAPNTTINCTANYTVTQANIDAGSISNVASATITVAGQTATGSSTVVVPAVRTNGLSIVKRLKAGSPSPFTAVGQQLIYEYVLTNTGNTTLSSATIADNKVSATCPSTTIAPNATMICTSAAYSVTQTDLNTGNVQNTATATATSSSGSITSAPKSLTVPAQQSPALSVVKTAPTVTNLLPGQTIQYSYTVTNSGNVTITAPITITDDKIGSNLPCSTAPLVPTATVTCTATYTVQPADVTAGFITNVAVAKSGTTTSPSATATVPQAGAPGLTLGKVANTASFNSTANTLNYTFTVTNSGSVNILPATPITINDPNVTLSGCTQPAVLYPVGSGFSPTSYTCTGTFSGLTSAHLDAGQFTNTATASLVKNGATVTSPSASATVPANITPAFTLTKSSTSTYSNVGDQITYTFTAQNSTEQTLASVVVTDPKIPGLSCTLTNIPGLGSKNCTGIYSVTQADLDAGQVDNTASALGTSPLGTTATASDTETVLINPAAQTKSMVLTKVASPTTFTAVGNVITYTMQVQNTGNLTLTNVVVTDAALGLNCTIGSIAPTTTNSSCTATKTITQADIDAGSYTNTAGATAPGALPVSDDVTVTGPARVATWDFTKTASGPFTTAGDIVNFTLSVKNTGNVTLTNLVITDDFFTPDLTCTLGSLAPGATNATCTGAYTVSQADVDAGSITNTADLTGNGVGGAAITDDATAVVAGPAPAPAMTVSKVEQDGTGDFGAVGTTETFTFSVENTGNVTLTSPVLTDDLTGFSCTLPDLEPGDVATTCATPVGPLSTTYTIQQADIDAASLTNSVEVTATPAAGTLAPAVAEVTLNGPAQKVELTIDKSSTAGVFDSVGDLVSYSYEVTNNGNITLTNPITVADNKTTVICPALPALGLAPLAKITCTATYAIKQIDLNTGSVTNVASASVTQTIVPSIDFPTGIAAVTSPTDSETVATTQLPAFSIVKRIKPGTATTFDAPLQPIVFEFIVRNTGNVTLLDPITIDDPQLSVTGLACGAPPVLPNGTVTCEATWLATQAAIDAGSFTNSATPATTFGGAPLTTPPPATATALAIKRPELTTAKTLSGISNNTFAVNEIASYDYVVTNTGNVTVNGLITVSDNLIPGVVCPPGNIAPSLSITCTGTYTISVDDLELGSVTNVARATGTLPGGGTIRSAPDSETIPSGALPTLSITKVADKTTFTAVGEEIVYTFVISNTSPGNAGIKPAILESTIFVDDDQITTPIVCTPTGDGQLSPAPAEVLTCVGTYLVTQDDLDRVVAGGGFDGFVTNNATANATFGMTDIVSPPVSVTVDATSTPMIETTKSVANQTDPGQPAALDDTLLYTITVTNTGNTNLSGIVVTDPMLTGLTCPQTTLAPTLSFDCTGTYVVTQDDIDAQILTNTASASGTSPQGEPVDDDGTVDAVLASPDPVLSVVKALAVGTPAAAYQAPGEMVDFVITVTNDGNVTLNNVTVTDSLVPGICTIGTLIPGQVDSSTCVFTYEIKQTDIDAGTITNIATGKALPAHPGATELTTTDTLVGTGPLREPSVSVGKIADPKTFLNAGETISYTYLITNTGNVTLTAIPTVVDNKIGPITNCEPIPVGGLLPLAEISCTATADTIQTDVDLGSLTNIVDVTMANPYPVGPATLTATATETVTAVRTPRFTIVKAASIDAGAAVGDIIDYTYTVTNTGNVTLTNVTLTDAHTSAAGTSNLTILPSNVIATMLPDDEVELTASYTVTQADIDAGAPLTNIVSGTATSPSGTTSPTATDDASVGVEDADPSLVTLKSVATPAPEAKVGEIIVYNISVENTGNVTLSAPTFTDELSRLLDGSIVSTTLVPTLVATSDTDGDGSLDVGETWEYTLEYEITQDDVDQGGLSNTLTATAIDPFDTEKSDVSDTGTGGGDDPAEFIIPSDPSVATIKSVRTLPTNLLPGQNIIFEISVENTGNVSLSDIVVTDTMTRKDTAATVVAPAPTAVYESGDTDTDGKLDADEIWIYTVTHELTQADVDAGGIENEALATGTAPDGEETSDGSNDGVGPVDGPVDVVIAPDASMLVLKTIPTLPAELVAGAEIVWKITVENTGTVTLAAPTLVDELKDAKDVVLLPAPVPTYQSGDLGTADVFEVDEIWVYEARYTLTQDDVDAGGIANSVTASSTQPNGDPVEDVSSDDESNETNPTVLTIEPDPSLEVVKTIPTPPAAAVVGAVVTYEITVENTGNVRLFNVDPVDDLTTINGGTAVAFVGPTLIDGDLNDDLILDVDEIWVYSLNHELTQTDLDEGGLTNTVTVTAEDPNGEPTDDISNNAAGAGETPTDFVISPDASLEVVKTVKTLPTSYVVGAEVVFEVTVTNTGNVTLTAPQLTDTMKRADDVDTAVQPVPALQSGDIGEDAIFGVDEVWVYSVTYALDQADIDAGGINNSVFAEADDPNGDTVDDTSDNGSGDGNDPTVVDIPQDPELTVIKTVRGAGPFGLGDTITYDITVENTGTVTLTAPVLTDELRRNTGELVLPNPVATYVSGDEAMVDMIDVGEIWTYTVEHEITQDDVDAGGVANQVTATSQDPNGEDISDLSDDDGTGAEDPTVTTIDAAPSIIGEKTISVSTIKVGETVTFEITATNDGTVTLNFVEVSSDTLRRADNTLLTLTSGPTFTGSSLGSAEGTLKVNEVATYVATYELIQADIDAGGISNRAVVYGEPPLGGPGVSDQTDDGDDTDGNTTNDPTVLVVPADPSMAMTKTLASGGPTFNAVDDVLTYTFTVENTGNVTLTAPISITDPLITNAGGTITCEPGPLAPMATLDCTGSYAITQADLDRGSVINMASATDGSISSPNDTVTVPALKEPALTLVKDAVSIKVGSTTYPGTDAIHFVVGAVVNYTYTTTNTGNVTLTTPVTVTDNLIPSITCPAFPETGLAPQATYVCTGEYTVKPNDVILTSVTNIARATSGPTASPITSETVPADGEPSLEIVKELVSVANPDLTPQGSLSFDQVGDILTYRFTVTNAGTLSFAQPVTVTDTLIGDIVCYTPDASNPDLTPLEQISCEATYEVAQPDLDAGEVLNEAYATTTFGEEGTPVTSIPDSVTTPADLGPELTVTKSAQTLPVTQVGQTLTYTITLENSGNQTLTNLTASDPMLDGFTCEIAELAPGALDSCDGTYIVTQADIDAGSLTNTATATAITPQGGQIPGQDTLVIDMPAADPAFTLTKAASLSPFGAAGSTVTYRFTAENTGTVTLFDVVVTDDIVTPPFTCTIPRLDVDAVNSSCTLIYTVTQADVDAGEIVNTASATATDPFGTDIGTDDTITTPGPVRDPRLEVTKTARPVAAVLDAVITYDVAVENTGNVSVTLTGLVDELSRSNGEPTALDTGLTYVSGDTDDDGKIGVDEIWAYVGTHIITQDDVNAGGLSNTVTASGTGAGGIPVSDKSDNGDDTDGDTTGDPTVTDIAASPSINAVKTVATAGSEPGDVVLFEIVVTNTGNVDLVNVGVADTLRRLNGSPVTGVITGPTLVTTPATPGILAPNEVWTFEFSYELTQEDVDAGGIRNIATASGLPPESTTPVTDLADDGDDTDGNTTGDPTIMPIAPSRSLDVVKTVTTPADAVDEEVVFTITVTNTGNVTINNLVVTDSLRRLDGTPVLVDPPVLVLGDSPTRLVVDGVNTYELRYVLTQADIDAGGLLNNATARGTGPDGALVTDRSKDGDPNDGNDVDDPTQLLIAPVETMAATKVAGLPVRTGATTFDIPFTITIQNTGTVTQEDVLAKDDLAAFAAPALVVGTTAPVATGFGGTATANAGFDGTADTDLLAAGNVLVPGATGTIAFTVSIDTATGNPASDNTVSVTAARLSGILIASAAIIPPADPQLVATKSATPTQGGVGTVVTYTVTFRNDNAFAESNLTLADDLPSGISYVADSATWNGAATPQPTVTGSRLRWADVTFAPGETITLTYQGRVTSGGELTNRAYVLNASGDVVSNIATATVRVAPEAVFDCGDVIGKVFDDRNQNGYQDGPSGEDINAITDQTYYGDKADTAPAAEENTGEPGLANARVVTVDGSVITTDEFGRFHVPCALLPSSIGSNFTLKLDERSLPTGYRVTTENPRTVRLTDGTVTKLNFGASIANVIDIDLTAAAFAVNTAEPSAALRAGVDQLIAQMRDTPSVLRLSYYRNGESQATARARLDAVEVLIRDHWRTSGRYRLLIERTIREVQ